MNYLRFFEKPLLILSMVFGAPSVALAQDAVPTPPEGGPVATKAAISPGARYLMELYKISADEAMMRLNLQDEVTALATTLAAENPDDFGGVWIEHEPTYKIVVAFKGADLRSKVRDAVEPKLRRYVQIKNVRTSVKEREIISDRIITALSNLNLEYVSYYEHKSDDFVIETTSDLSIGKIRQSLPQDLQSSIKIRKGSVPRKIQASNFQSGDATYPGFWWSATSGGPYVCSFSFAAKDNQGRSGILTAGHCPNTDAFLYDTTPSPHWIKLAKASVNWNIDRTKYDYRFYLTTGIDTGAWLSYNNTDRKIFGTDMDFTPLSGYSSRNVISGYPASGYYKVIGTYGYYDQKVGDVICKTGHSSGLTCGQITHGYYTFNGAKGWIETGLSTQYYYVIGGDSGGAVFTSPNVNGEIKAAGIVTAATIYDPTLNPDGTPNNSGDEKECSSAMEGNRSYDNNLAPGVAAIQDCKMVHMPIDYIDDQQLLTIITQPAS